MNHNSKGNAMTIKVKGGPYQSPLQTHCISVFTHHGTAKGYSPSLRGYRRKDVHV